mgnify:CR=1 FL=1
MSQSATEYRWDIQALRAFAVVVVILFHSDVFLPNGYLGVDVFFVISGFVISRSVINGFQEVRTFSVRGFVARRIRRLLPALCAMLCGSIVISTFFESWLAEQWRTQSTALVALFSFSNIWFLVDKIDYFSPSNEFNLLLHTWSLSVEEQFYVAFALIAPLISFLVRIQKIRKSHVRALLAVFVLISAIIFIRLTSHPLSPPTGVSLKSFGKILLNPFYGIVSRSWEFGVGILVALGPVVHRKMANTVSGISLIALFVVMRLWPSSTSGNHWLNLAAVVSAAGICMRRVETKHSDGHSAPNRLFALLVSIGDRSYSLYLWHWPFLVIVSRYSRLDREIQLAIAWTMTAVVADLSYRCIERRFMRTRQVAPYTTRRVLLFSWSSVIGVFLVAWLIFTPFLQSRSGLRNAYVDHGCDPWTQPCPRGPIENGVLLLVGDSHAMAVSEAIYNVANEFNLGVILRAHKWLDPQEISTFSRDYRVAGLVVVRSWNSWNPDQLHKLEDVSEFYSPSKTIVVHDNPIFPDWVPPTVLGPKARGVSRREALEQQTDSRNLINSWSEKYSGFTADLLQDVCDAQWCPIRDSQGFFYIDDNHLSKHGLSLVNDRLRNAIAQLLNS